MNRRSRTSAAVAALALAATTLVSAAPAQAKHRPCPTLSVSAGWYGDNKARLDRLIADHCADARTKGRKPLAVFDWDNTVIKNDVGDATLYWLLRNDRVRPPRNDDWSTTSRHLTPAAATALRAACPTGVRTLPTATDARCADEIRSVYSDGATTGGAAAFAGFDHRRTEPQYAWLAQLLRGWTVREVESFAAAARAENLAAPQGATQRVGTARVTGWIRPYDQQRDLIDTLRRAGFDVWIVSASPEPVVDVWARGVGIDPSHAIGIRNTTEHGRLTAHFQGCGTVRDGEDTMITYIDGKRCWINREILGVRGPAAERVQPAARRQVLAAGDSDTDVTFLRDATGLRLVLNRNKNELMCRAYENGDGRWLVNPMFIEPKARKTTPYPCATTGHTAGDGTAGPVRRADGSVIPDQEDTVY
ncbi:HAD family phosphatase [Streptomyces sp. WAC08241]|uniref:HAD family hydrolase n=1 Tax=Streptomyces sp. WAC08241 TaxID=2487421 RepID=UPI000F788331|nr:haloacid dehalogenase-like hydrolase [Streptomyces sp. WAC08241]RSS38760.1 haloacid dehalogenase-like hydrolase [Streptomyces sp. WAC08241]